MSTTLEDLKKGVEDQGAGTENIELEKQRIAIGGSLVWGILGLIVLAGVAIIVYAAASKPMTATELKSFDNITDPVGKASELHTAWFNEIKDLGQVYIVALLIPVLTALIGYIFGKSTAASSDGSA
jgi:hypothetical protein